MGIHIGHTSFYILNDNDEIERCDNMDIWTDFFCSNRRVLMKTWVGAISVTTMFLAIDSSDGKLWETSYLEHGINVLVDRYRTRDEAFKGHERVVSDIRNRIH